MPDPEITEHAEQGRNDSPSSSPQANRFVKLEEAPRQAIGGSGKGHKPGKPVSARRSRATELALERAAASKISLFRQAHAAARKATAVKGTAARSVVARKAARARSAHAGR